MDVLGTISFDSVIMALITCLVLREAFILTLPDAIAGPGGWLINTDGEED